MAAGQDKALRSEREAFMNIDFKNMDENELYKLRIAFDDNDDAIRFIDMVVEDLEVRIGEQISDGLTKKQLAEFDSITEPKEAAEWLRKNKPDFRDIVSQVSEEVETELFLNRYQIAGARVTDELCGNSAGVEKLRLSEEAMNWISNEGIHTIGELAEKDLSLSGVVPVNIIKEIIDAFDSYRLFSGKIVFPCDDFYDDFEGYVDDIDDCTDHSKERKPT